MFWGKIAACFGSGKNRSAAGDLRRRLLHILYREGGLELDPPTLARIGVDFRQICHEAYALAGQECLHLLAEPGEPITLLSNEQFNQITRIRACLPERRSSPIPASGGSEAASARPAAGGMTGGAPKEKGEGGPASTPLPAVSKKEKVGKEQANDFDWFSLEVAMPDRKRRRRAGKRGKRLETPAERRVLPERRREPWVILDAASLEAEFFKKE